MKVTFVVNSYGVRPNRWRRGGVPLREPYGRAWSLGDGGARRRETGGPICAMANRRRPTRGVRGRVADRSAVVRPRVSWLEINPAVDMRYVPRLVAHDVPDGDAVIATGWQSADGVAGLPSSKGAHCYLIQHHETWSGSERRVDSTWRLPMRRIFISPWLYRRALGMGLEDSHRVPRAGDRHEEVSRKPADRRTAEAGRDALVGVGVEGRRRRCCRARRSPVFRSRLASGVVRAGPRPADLPAWIEYEQNPAQDKLVVEIYNGSSIYLCPSHAEGWHLPPAEAMASGCAVVSTDIDGVADYTLAGETAHSARRMRRKAWPTISWACSPMNRHASGSPTGAPSYPAVHLGTVHPPT